MLVEVVTDLDGVNAVVPAWRELLADSACDEVSLSPEWLLTWWGVFGQSQGRRLRFVLLREGDRLVGLAPLLSRRHWYAPGLPFRRLEPLGAGERDQDSICTDYLNLIARRGFEADVACAFVEALAAGRFDGWDELVIPLMSGSGPMPELLAEAARRSGLGALLEETTRAPYVRLPATWDDYLTSLGKKDRYLVRRTLADFEKWAGDEWRLAEATATTLQEGKRVLHALHHARWQGDGAGVFRSPLFMTFHDRAMPLLLARDSLELLWLVVRDTPVAAVYNIRWSGKTSFYQCGRTLDVPRGVRPGGVLLYLAIRRAIEEGQREFDFLGGDAVYKRQLANATRPLMRLRLARHSLVERGLALTECAKNTLRPIWRRLRGAVPRPPPIDDMA